MEKIDRETLRDGTIEEWREEVMDKLDEIVDWIKEQEATRDHKMIDKLQTPPDAQGDWGPEITHYLNEFALENRKKLNEIISWINGQGKLEDDDTN